jgi:DNA-binding response OmpR family regulator
MSARILLAEGEHSIEQTVAQSLTTEQIETVCADDGWSALCLLNETSPDVLIAEIALPNKSGYELCRYVREEPEFQSMPVVLIDDHFDPLNQDLASSVGANVYLSKPFEPSQLIEIVRKLLGSRQESYDEELASAMLPASSQQSPLLQSHGSAEVNAVRNADWILPARQPSGAQTGTDSLPEPVPTHPRRGSYVVLWAVLAGAILAALALAILERNHVSNAPTAS